MRVLLLKPETELRHLFAFMLETEFGLQVREATSVHEGLEVLEAENEGIDFILCDDVRANQIIIDRLAALGITGRCFVLRRPGVASVCAGSEVILASLNPLALLPDLRAKLPLITPKTNSEGGREVEHPDYCKLGAELVLSTMPLQADTYLQIGGGKLVKVFKKGDLIKGKEVTDFLSSKKIAFLYIKKGDASLFMDRLNQEVERLLNDPAMTPDKATGLATDLHQAVSELNRRLGFTPEVQKVVHQGIRTALQSVGVNPELAKILKGMVQDRHRYIASHSVLVSQVSCGIAAMMKWPSDTTFQKLSYAAFFHDMTLENHSLAQVGSLKELEEREAEFTMDEIKSYRSHPADAAQLISTFHEIPSDVDTILIQHHERPEGDGFPRGLPPMQMASLSCVFVVAHDWVDQLFKNGNSGLEDYMQHYKTRCNRGPFKKIIEAIEASGGFKL